MTKKPNDSCLRLLLGMTGLLITSNNGRTLKIQTEALPAFDPKRTWASRFCCDARLRPAILGIVPGLIEMQRREFIGLLGGDASLALCIGRTKRPTGRRTMRAIGLVLLSIAIMALLLTDADAKRRSSAQGSQAAGAKESWCATYPSQGINDNCSYFSFNQCYQTAVLGRGGFCRPNPFPGTPYGTGYTWSGPKR